MSENRPILVKSKAIADASLLKPKSTEKRFHVRLFFLLYILIGGCFCWVYFGSAYSSYMKIELILVVYGFLIFLNLLMYLFTLWSVRFRAFCHYDVVRDVNQATHLLLIVAKYKGKSEIITIMHEDIIVNSTDEFNLSFTFQSPATAIEKTNIPVILFQQNKLLWNTERKCFEKLKFPLSLSFGDYQSSKGLVQVENIQQIYGINKFSIPQPLFSELFKEHAIAPFFLFQIFCVTLWMLDEYWYYSLFTLVMLVFFECTVVQQRISNMKEFKTMSIIPYKIACKREGKWMDVMSDELLPGDLVSIRMEHASNDSTVVPCDLLLLDGGCVVNEAMLSGESTPLQKEPIVERKEMDYFDISADKNHVLFGGTKILQISPSFKTSDDGCLCYVLRTGFHTTQGKLVRTMLFNVERVTANNAESFMFIVFLLIFALIASGYVWKEGVKDPLRSKYKLLLECILIVTQVIPPELPMELSLAVNTSLIALAQFAIFCTEPFRIPLAGKIDVCCLDKTGTITEENLQVKGVSLLHQSSLSLSNSLFDCKEVPLETSLTLAACHSLMLVEDKIVGDPMEKAALAATDWNLVKNDNLINPKSKIGVKILKKFQFSSSLKRMSTIASILKPGTEEKIYVFVKGAPEVLQQMFTSLPSFYEETFKGFARDGCRVISLGFKQLNRKSNLDAAFFRNYERCDAEKDLTFVGFLIFHCPFKTDSERVISDLMKSSHKIIMITGDNALTGIHVAVSVGMASENCFIIDCDKIDGEENLTKKDKFLLHNVDDSFSEEIPFSKAKDLLALIGTNDVCISGSAYDAINSLNNQFLIRKLLSRVCVFARASPQQKESIILSLKDCNLTTLMCGDGTNDVGALKQAHIGVALLDGKPEELEKIKRRAYLETVKKQQEQILKSQQAWARTLGQPIPTDLSNNPMSQKLNSITKMLDDDQLPTIRLGDASVAAPFTSKLSTLDAVCNIIKQGRCTLVTTIQMYKILALNSLISAYSLSVLQLEGVRYGDYQSTIMGFLITFCFLFLSKGKPLTNLSVQRPQSNIFNVYILSSIIGQFIVHLICLIYINQQASRFIFPRLTTKFEPGLTNSIVYLMSLSMQVATFMVNYQGRPFRESLFENKPLRNSLFGVAAIAFGIAFEIFPEWNQWLEIVVFPASIKCKLILTMVADLLLSAAVEQVAHRLFANENPKPFFQRQSSC